MKPDAAMVMTTRMAESLGVGPNTSTTNTLTPTTLRSITQLFESEDCLSNLKRIEEDPAAATANAAGFAPLAVDKTSFVNLDSKSGAWHGGTTTVLTPSKVIPHIGVLMADGQEEELEGAVKEDDTPIMVQPHIVTETTPASTRPRRSAARHVRFADDRDASPDYEPPKKSSRKSSSGKKKASGRKPRRGSGEEERGDYSPEEWDRVMVRRQRNKEAAARCRKRRVDLTNQLLEEVEGHEGKKRELEDEIRQLKAQKEELEFILEAHAQHCKIMAGGAAAVRPPAAHQQAPAAHVPLVVAVKSEPAPANLVVTQDGQTAVVVEAADAPYVIPETVTLTSAVTGATTTAIVGSVPKPRPASLSLAGVPVSESGVVIETPSTVVPALAFDTVTTGLTPMGVAPTLASIVTPTLNTPTCSAQQRSMEAAANAAASGSPVEYVTL